MSTAPDLASFTTENGTTIPGWAMDRVCSRLFKSEDWQRVGTEELRRFIPQGEDDLSELNEVLTECERRNDGP